jgi:hypothetical protein
MTTLDKYLAEVKARSKAATPGPWFSGSWSGRCHLKHAHGRDICRYEYTFNSDWKACVVARSEDGTHINVVTTTEEYGALSDTDSEFIAHAPTDIDRLREMVEKQTEALRAAQFHFAVIKSHTKCIGSTLCHVDGNCVYCAAVTSEMRVRAALAELERIARGEK